MVKSIGKITKKSKIVNNAKTWAISPMFFYILQKNRIFIGCSSMEKSSPRFYNLSVKRKEKKMTTKERIITIRLLDRIKVDPVTAKRIIKKVRITKGGKQNEPATTKQA